MKRFLLPLLKLASPSRGEDLTERDGEELVDEVDKAFFNKGMVMVEVGLEASMRGGVQLILYGDSGYLRIEQGLRLGWSHQGEGEGFHL